MKMNLPNKLTVLRVLMVPFFVFFALADFIPHHNLIAGLIFRKFNYIRNYKACKKGAIAGLITTGVIVALFGLMLLLALL